MGNYKLISKSSLLFLLLLTLDHDFGFTQSEFKIGADDIGFGDLFGFSVSISGNYAIIGAPFDNDRGDDSGSFSIFKRSGSSWHQSMELTPSDAVTNDLLGFSVAVSGDIAVIGAPFADGSTGAAYVFRRRGASWGDEAKLTVSDQAPFDNVGFSVAISGETVVVGAPFKDDSTFVPPHRDAGAAYVFIRDGTSWQQQEKLTAPGAGPADQLGRSVSVSGDIAVIGAPFADGSTGAAYVFRRRGASWGDEAKLTVSDQAPFDNVGFSVAISGEVIVVGAPAKDAGAGAAYVFTRDNSLWNLQAKLTASDAGSSDNFGLSVAIGGETVLVGAPSNDDAGAAYVFIRDGNDLKQVAKLTASDATAGDQFGRAVSASAVSFLAGAPFDDTARENSGSAYIYHRAPVIKHEVPDTPEINQDILILANIASITSIASAQLNYRQGGERSFAVKDLSGTGDALQRSIPANVVTSRGLEYFIVATDSLGQTSRFPLSGFISVQIRVGEPGVVKNDPQPGGSAATAYRLFSVPLDLGNKRPAHVLEDDLGSFDRSNWRFVELRADQSYVDFPSTFFDLSPGTAFWLIVREPGRIIDTGPGLSNLTDNEFAIPLHQQWNFIGNPFNFTIPLTNMRLASGATLTMRFYDGAYNDPIADPVPQIIPFDGYAVFSELDVDTLFVNPDLSASANPLQKSSVSNKVNDLSWSIRILASCQEARDVDNFAAVHQEALLGWDELDLTEPPLIGDYVSVYFPHPEWRNFGEKYCTDFRPESSTGDFWEFEVKTNIRDKVELTFTGLKDVPNDFEVWLVDELLNVRQNLREANRYSVAGVGENYPKRLKILVGKSDFVDDNITGFQNMPRKFELSQNFPNPFNPVTSIRYALPKEESVTLRVYNILGEEVVTLLNDRRKSAGYHVAIWDGRDKHGRNAASGVYFSQIHAGDFIQTRKMLLIE